MLGFFAGLGGLGGLEWFFCIAAVAGWCCIVWGFAGWVYDALVGEEDGDG